MCWLVGGFTFFASADNFVSVAPEAAAAPVAVPMEVTTASGRSPLMAVMETSAAAAARSLVGVLVLTAYKMAAVLCSAHVMVNHIYLKAARGCGPGGSGDYPQGEVGSHASFSLILSHSLLN